jgi:hypothetical protein
MSNVLTMILNAALVLSLMSIVSGFAQSPIQQQKYAYAQVLSQSNNNTASTAI